MLTTSGNISNPPHPGSEETSKDCEEGVDGEENYTNDYNLTK